MKISVDENYLRQGFPHRDAAAPERFFLSRLTDNTPPLQSPEPRSRCLPFSIGRSSSNKLAIMGTPLAYEAVRQWEASVENGLREPAALSRMEAARLHRARRFIFSSAMQQLAVLTIKA
jgi:hypothetical protein